MRTDNPREAPFARITGRSPMTSPWINQRRMPADSTDAVHRDMSLDSFNLYTRMIWGILEKVVIKLLHIQLLRSHGPSVHSALRPDKDFIGNGR
jgi:hypothetical protein